MTDLGLIVARGVVGGFGLFIGLLCTPHIVGSIRLGRELQSPTVVWWAWGWTVAIVAAVLPCS